MNVLNIISSTLNKQQSTYFRKSESVISPRSQGMGLEVLQARQFSSMNRSIILDEVKSKLPNPDWEVVIRLCNGLFQSDENSKGYSKVLYAALALKEWLILHGYDGDSVNQRQELLTLARGHLEVWLLKGVAAESHHLRRSKELYTQYFKSFPESATARDQVDFCKVLLFLGEWHQAADIIVHVVTHYDHDPQISNYLFYAGVIFKSMAEYDRASTYFFEANECGPPRYFSQIEMMTVISRNLEAMNEEGEGEDNDDAYRMVHAHLLMEGMISEDTDYEDWIFDANTWLALGDKCAMHHMYSLATDFYGLGIMRDPDAFRKPMLWLRFAKACKRCGRKADALLAIKQALSRDPFNPQLNRAFRYCNEDENTRFPTLLLGDLSAILELLPPDEYPEEMVVNRLQAAVKGAIERNELRLGVGARRDKANRPMQTRLGVVVQGQAMLLRVQASWMGKVTHIKVFDVCKGTTSKIKLRTPFAPVRETGTPRRLVLTMQMCKYPSSKRASRSLKAANQQEEGAELELRSESSVDVELVLKFTDRDTGRYSYRRMRLNLLNLAEGTPGNEKQVDLEELPPAEHRSLLDLPEHPSLYNTLLRNGGAGQGDALHEPSLAASVAVEGTLTSAGSPRLGVTSIAQGQERFDLATSEYRFATATVSTLEDSELPFGVVSVTNAQTVELVKEGFQWRGLFYLVRVVNEHDVTQVTLTQLCSDRVFIFLMAREHLDRSHSLAKRWSMLLSILERNPAAKHFLQPHSGRLLVSDNFSLLDGPSELQLLNSSLSELPSFAQNNPLQLTVSEHQAAVAALEAPLTILNKVVYTSLLPRGNGVSILLVDPRNRPMIGSSLEILDNVDFVPSSLSLMRSSVAERFRSEVFPDAVASMSLPPKPVEESAAVHVDSEEEQSLGRDDGSSQLEYGSAVELVGEDDEGLGFDSSDKVVVGDDSAYELVGTAAAVGGGSARALSAEEYADMLQREAVLHTQDSDMVGLRYGGALDEDSVSLLQYPHSAEWSPRPPQQLADGSRENPQHELLVQEVPVTTAADSAESIGLQVPTAQEMHADAERALEEAVQVIDEAGAADSESESTSVITPVRPPLSTSAPASDSRVLAARQSISLGQNLGAALTAALQAGEGKRRHSSAQQQLGMRPSTAMLTPQRQRKISVKPGSTGYKAIVQVKAAAVGVVSIAMGSALLCALAAITGTAPDADSLPVAWDASAVSIEASLDRSLGAIQEDDADSQDGSTAEGDWIAKLFADQDLGASDSGSLDEEEITLGTGMEQAEELAQEEPSLLFEDDQEEAGDEQVPSNDRRRTRTMTSATSASSGTSGFDLNEDDTESAAAAAALAAQVDIEWIVELGSSGAMEQFEETLLEELFEQGVQHWAEVVSDQIPVVRIPLLQSALKEGTESAQQVFVYSSEILDRELAREVEFQAMCVTLVQVGEAVAVRRAIKSILATEKARELARRRLANEERVKQAALKAAQEQQMALAVAAAPQTPVTVESKTPYRPIVVSESEEFLSALGGKGGYFVKKIRSQVYVGASETAGSPGKHQHYVSGRPRPHTTSSSSSLVAGMKRLVAMRDTFTPELPPSLQDGTTRHRHVDHLQQTALSGGISLSAVPSSPHTPSSALIPAGFDNGDAMFSQSMVPLHITENSAEKPAQFGAAWEASELSLNNYFQLDQEPAQSPNKQTIPLAGTSRRSAAEVSKLKRQVNHSRRAQNRNCPTDGEPPLWVSVGGANSASLLLPQCDPAATVPAFTATADSATFAPDQSSAFANTIGTLPFPTAKDTISSTTMPIISMLHSRAQSPAFPAAALPTYAFDSAEGLKRALQDNWSQQTIPRYWGSALKERADERINQPFAVKSANTRKQRRVIKAKSAFAAAAATQAMNSTAEQREHLDRQFTLMMADDEEVHESFFESHIGPFGLRDLPFQQTARRHLSEQAGGGGGAPELAASSSSKTTGLRSDAETEPRYAVRPQTAPDTGSRSERRDSLDQSDLGSEGYSFFNSLADAEAAQQEQQQRKQRSRARSGGDLSRRSQAFEFSFDAAADKAQNLEETAPLVHAVRKGLQHDHAFDDSILLSNQVEPPFHHLSTRIACRSPADMAVHFKRSTAAIAEQIDQAVEREEVDEMFRKSLEIFHKVGYVQKRPLPHATHWVKVVSHYLASLQSIDELRKRLSTLQRTSPRGLTTEEAVCVLSDVKGSVGQAVEKLKHPEYYAEVRLVCRSIQVRNMVLLLEGGEQVYNYRVGEAAGLTGQSTKVSWEDAPILVNRHGEWTEAKRPGSSEAKRPGSSMFVGMDEEALKAATLVTNPYGASITEQHREVVAHRKIREHYDEIRGAGSGSFSAPDPNSPIQPSGRSGKISRQSIRQSIRASFASLGGISEASEGQTNANEAAAQTVGTDGLFVPAGTQSKLRHDSRYVLSRASLITLQAQQNSAAASNHTQSTTGTAEPTTGSSQATKLVPSMARAGLRGSLAMSVSSPKKASMLLNNVSYAGYDPSANSRVGGGRYSVASGAQVGDSSFNLLDAIAAAVAAADGSVETGPVQDHGGRLDREREEAELRHLHGSISVSTTGRPSKRSSLRMSQRAWRLNSGIFDPQTPKSTSSAATPTSKRSSLKFSMRSMGQLARLSPGRKPPSPPKIPTTPTTPKYKLRADAGQFFLEEELPDVAAVRPATTGTLQLRTSLQTDGSLEEGIDEDEGADEGDSGSEEEQPPVTPPTPAPRAHVSINPWYLKQQQGANTRSTTTLTSSQPGTPKTPKTPTATIAETLPQKPQTAPALAPLQSTPSFRGMPAPMVREKSYRTENIVSEIFEKEALGVPFAVMSRRDAERATKDETLARSNKQYIRQSIELRALKYQHG